MRRSQILSKFVPTKPFHLAITLCAAVVAIVSLFGIQPAQAQTTQSAVFDLNIQVSPGNGVSISIPQGKHVCGEDCGIFLPTVTFDLGTQPGEWAIALKQEHIGKAVILESPNGTMKDVFLEAHNATTGGFSGSIAFLHNGDVYTDKAITVPACDYVAPTTTTTKPVTTTTTTKVTTTTTVPSTTSTTTEATTTTTSVAGVTTTTVKNAVVPPTTSDTPDTSVPDTTPVVSTATLPVTGSMTLPIALIAGAVICIGAAFLVSRKLLPSAQTN